MRSRNIKPALFKNEILGEADPLLTILFEGLWCMADREGKLEDRPKRIKAEIFPYRELPGINGEEPGINGYLTVLSQLGFIDRYSVGNLSVIKVLAFEEHQSPHKTEKASVLPENPLETDSCDLTVKPPLSNESVTVREPLIPDSGFLIPDSCVEGETHAQAMHEPSMGQAQVEEIASSPPMKKPASTARFKPPPETDVMDYMIENGLDAATASAQANRFWNFYDSKNWMVGKNKMTKWRSAAANWISWRNDDAQSKPNPVRSRSALELASGGNW